MQATYPHSPLSGRPLRPYLTLPRDWRRPNLDARYEIYWNTDDGFGQLWPRPDAAAIAASYVVDDYYTHSAGEQRADDSDLLGRLLVRASWQADRSVEIDADWFARRHGNRPQRVLDIGCGSGRILALLRDAGHTVVGVEPDPAARAVATQRGLTVFDGTAEALPAALHDATFDAILLTHVLEHCADPLQALRNAAALLRAGGKLTVETPNNRAAGLQQAGSVWRWLDVPRHLNFFTPDSLLAICRQAGLTPLTTEYRGYTRQFKADWLAAEQTIWERFRAAQGSAAGLPPRPSRARQLRLLLRTLAAAPAAKYDSVRVIAAAWRAPDHE